MIKIFSILIAIFLLLMVLNLIYKKKLKEQYAFLWLVLSIGILFFSVFNSLIDRIAAFLGVYYAPSLLFVFSFLVLLLVLLQVTLVISKLKDNIKVLTQELSLLQKEVHSLKKDTNE